ncbi:MAG: glycosyl transferase family 2 [Dehalococcoidia bacterium]|nr:glycosyl transferase family 2 [Dehalococcoidia bacterium]
MMALRAIALMAQSALILYSAYIFAMALGALRRSKPRKEESAHRTARDFAVIIPALDEEIVVGQLLKSFQIQDYPRDRFHIYVIADNCTDRTAEVAREHGAIVHERFSDNERTKGYAIRFLLQRLEAEGVSHDVYVIIDADNIVLPSFLSEMNRAFERGHHVVQGFRATKNPLESWTTRLDYISECAAEMESRGRRGWGLSCGLRGTAMAFSSQLLDELGGWQECEGFHEDIKMQANCVLHGYRVAWWPEAVAYDEKLTSMKDMSSQRSRWLAGDIQVFRKYFFRLLARGIRRADFHRLEQALYLSRLMLPRSSLAAGALLMLCLSLFPFTQGIVWRWEVWAAALGGQFLCLVAGLLLARAPRSMYLTLTISPAFSLIWLRALAGGALGRRRYRKASHASTVTVDDILNKGR